MSLHSFVAGKATIARQTLLRGLADQNPGKLRFEFVENAPSAFLIWLGDEPEPLVLFGKQVEAFAAGVRVGAAFGDRPTQVPSVQMIAGHRFS
jgi:hypothetical protein